MTKHDIFAANELIWVVSYLRYLTIYAFIGMQQLDFLGSPQYKLNVWVVWTQNKTNQA